MGNGIEIMHDKILFYLILVLFLVLWLILVILTYFNRGKNFNIKRSLVEKRSIHGKVIELVWTITPGLILLLIGIPTFKLLYIMDLIIDPLLTVKGIGWQWYWEYEYQFESKKSELLESYINKELPSGGLNLANADSPLYLPIDYLIRLLTTSGDVIHSLAVPSLGLKGDGVPGRLNGLSLFINRSGSFYGQCSELCGVNHAFMPINLVGVDINHFISWLNK